MTISKETFAAWIMVLRQCKGWSQETLAEIATLSVRSVQRVEAGEPSSLHTRRALAVALGYEDVDFFNKPETSAQVEEAWKTIIETAEKRKTGARFP